MAQQDKTSALRSLLLRAWRERWSDVQWGIHLKSVLPRGCSGDAYNLSGLILAQALVGPVPNSLVLSYLRHSLASQTVSHAATLEAIASRDVQPDKDHCTLALLDLVDLSQSLVTSRGKPEDCLTLGHSLVKIVLWLLRLIIDSPTPAIETRVVQLLKIFVVDNDFTASLLYVGKVEDKENFSKISTSCKALTDQAKASPDLAAVLAALKNPDPMKLSGLSACNSSGLSAWPSFVHVIQPMLLYEALLHPASDLTVLSQHLYAVSLMHGINFTDLSYEIVRSLLLTISHNEGLEPLKVDTLILVRLPTLLEKLYRLTRSDSGAPLKTPTDLYKAFDKLLKNDSLLDSTDLRCKCNIIDILLRVVGKCGTPLMTDTEKDDVLKRRQSRIAEAKVSTQNIPEAIVGNVRNFELTLKAESTLDNVLKTFDTDFTKPESVENLLGVLRHVIKCESFDMWQAVASATGKLQAFIKCMIRFNQQSQESPGESVKSSLNRAALFDMTFLMLVYVVQCFGSEVVLAEAKGTFIATWINDMMVERDGRVKSYQLDNLTDNMVDNLLQHLKNGELRTQVVKWQNVCFNIHLAMKEMIIAKQQQQLKDDAYKKMVSTLCSKLCALPVCVMAWMASYNNFMPADIICIQDLATKFVKLAESEEVQVIGNSGNDVPYAKERVAMMSTILSKMQQQTGLGIETQSEFCDARTSQELNHMQLNRPLQESLLEIWHSVTAKGWLTIEAGWRLHDLLKSGGPNWFTSVLVEDLLTVVYQSDIDKQTELLRAVLHINIEQTTLSLLLHVVPGYLQYNTKREKLTDPHGTALAKLTVGCVYTVLMGAAGATPSTGSTKRKAEDVSDEVPSAKMQRLVVQACSEVSSGSAVSTISTFSTTFDDCISSQQRATDAKDDNTGSNHPVALAVSGFLKLLHAVVSCQETNVTPCTHFAFRFLEQVAMKGGRSQTARSRLILQHMSIGLILHLVRIVPDLFSMGIIAKLFDVTSVTGRKSMARVMCLLRNIKVHKEKNLPSSTNTLISSQG